MLISLFISTPTSPRPFDLSLHYSLIFSASVHLCSSIFILLSIYRTEHVRAILDFTFYAGFMFFWNPTFHSEWALPPCVSSSFSLLSTPPTLLFSHCHLPLTLLVLSPSFSVSAPSLKCLAFSLRLVFATLVFISHSLGCSPPCMLIMSLC